MIQLLPKPIRIFLTKYERHIPACALASGFLWDVFTIGRPDEIYGNIVILTYLLIALGCIILLNVRKSRGEQVSPVFLLAIMQFSFGTLAGSLLVFYGQSATLAGSWLFILLFAAFFIGNELVRSRYSLLLFHTSVYYLFLFSYSTLIIPVIVREMGPLVFLASGVVSLLIMFIIVALLALVTPSLIRPKTYTLSIAIFLVFAGMSLLYVFNFVPPVPLSLKEIAVVHGVSRDAGGNYSVLVETGPRYFLSGFFTPTLRYVSGESAYCFSSVFAPAGLSVPIRHRWEFLNPVAFEWQTRSVNAFPISGGREDGYRGFSIKTISEAGKWRCAVETLNGALIGRRSFGVVLVPETVPLVREAR